MRIGLFRKTKAASAPQDGVTNVELLRGAAERLRACYEVWPDWALVNSRRVQDGFEVDLYAGPEGLAAGACLGIYEELRQIAIAVLPRDAGDAALEVLAFDNAIHESPNRQFRPEVVVGLRIFKKGIGEPLDASERRCLREIERALRQLGVRRVN
jgi:hypothetical protein